MYMSVILGRPTKKILPLVQLLLWQGGVTLIGCMPNTNPPTVDSDCLAITQQVGGARDTYSNWLVLYILLPLSEPGSVPGGDYGLFLGASSSNFNSLHRYVELHVSLTGLTGQSCLFRLAGQALALKMYLNTTFTSLKLDSMEVWMKVKDYLLTGTWPSCFTMEFLITLFSMLRCGQKIM